MTITKLRIRLYGDPALRQKSSPVKEVGPAERMLMTAMIETMHEHKGIGLAAPQVGINARIIVVDAGEGAIALANPKIVKKKGSSVLEEGCLSIPGVLINIRRPSNVIVKYIDENNQPAERACMDLLAKAIQHEIDHLNGRLIVDYASLREKIKFRKQLKELKEQSKNQT